MQNPYSPPEATLGHDPRRNSRIRVMLYSATISAVAVPLLISGFLHLVQVPASGTAYAGIVVVEVPLSVLSAAGMALLRNIPLYAAVSACVFITLFLSVALLVFIGTMYP
jgi:hypothetical protein